MASPDIHRAVDAVWRIESARLIAGLARIVRDVGVAEELAQDALVAALEQWPESGIPDNPGAWLMVTAKHRAMDLFRRNKLVERKHAELGRDLELQQETAVAHFEIAQDDNIGDDLLRLVFVSCHPVLSREARIALTLRLLGGLTTQEIARAFLIPEPTVAQRIVRAKRTLTEARVPFEVPRGPDLAARLSSVLEVIYLIFNEGYSATAGEDWMRPALCEDALRLGRILAGLAPNEAEVHGLVGLMEIQASRAHSRVGPEWRAHTALSSGSHAMGSYPHPARTGRAAAGRRTRRRPWPPRAAGGHRRMSRSGAHRGGDGLAAHCRALRCTGRAHALAGGRAESRRGDLDGIRSGSRPRADRHTRIRTVAQGLSSVAQRARRSVAQARPLRRGPPGIRARCGPDAECTGAPTAAGTRRGVLGGGSYDEA